MKPTNEEYDYEDCRPPTGKLNDQDKAFVERLKKAKKDEKSTDEKDD